MPEGTLDPFHDPYNLEWVNDVPQDLYPWHMPARHYLGRGDGCQWEGTGFFYTTRESSPEEVHLQIRWNWTEELEKAGNRHRAPHAPTALYRVRDAAGCLLYVGVSGAPFRRWTEHAADKPWWPEAAAFALEWFYCRPAALAAEATAIRAEGPKYNVVHNQAAA